MVTVGERERDSSIKLPFFDVKDDFKNFENIALCDGFGCHNQIFFCVCGQEVRKEEDTKAFCFILGNTEKLQYT